MVHFVTLSKCITQESKLKNYVLLSIFNHRQQNIAHYDVVSSMLFYIIEKY